jgi:hypothetical protein
VHPVVDALGRAVADGPANDVLQAAMIENHSI